MEAAPLTTLFTSVVALGGAVAGWLKNRSDHRRGVRADDREDLTSQQDRYERYIERVEGRLNDLESDVETLRTDLSEERRRYQVAVNHVRDLTRWIAEHMPSGVPSPPPPPSPITDDL
ncbi:MAG: hypothetical protein ACTH02_09495 [Corynebacterium sp.]